MTGLPEVKVFRLNVVAVQTSEVDRPDECVRSSYCDQNGQGVRPHQGEQPDKPRFPAWLGRLAIPVFLHGLKNSTQTQPNPSTLNPTQPNPYDFQNFPTQTQPNPFDITNRNHFNPRKPIYSKMRQAPATWFLHCSRLFVSCKSCRFTFSNGNFGRKQNASRKTSLVNKFWLTGVKLAVPQLTFFSQSIGMLHR